MGMARRAMASTRLTRSTSQSIWSPFELDFEVAQTVPGNPFLEGFRQAVPDPFFQVGLFQGSRRRPVVKRQSGFGQWFEMFADGLTGKLLAQKRTQILATNSGP